jgi:hypothetical protein
MAAEFCLRNISIHTRKVLLHAVNLYFLRRKLCYHRPRSGSNPRTLGPVASTLTTSPLRASCNSQNRQHLVCWVLLLEKQCVLCGVRNEFWNISYVNLRLQSVLASFGTVSGPFKNRTWVGALCHSCSVACHVKMLTKRWKCAVFLAIDHVHKSQQTAI